MAFPRELWQQLKNLTADQLISALRRDGWQADTPSGAIHPFIHPTTRQRVTIHYHPKKTYGEKLLQGLLKDIGWSGDDFVRLGLARAKAPKREKSSGSLDVGSQNEYGQLLVEEFDAGTWIVLCVYCGSKYGSA